jgi:hypothetical protein
MRKERNAAVLLIALCLGINAMNAATLQEKAAAARQLKQQIMAINTLPASLAKIKQCDVLTVAHDAVDAGVIPPIFSKVWQQLGQSLLNAARNRKDVGATRILVDICDNQDNIRSLSCINSNNEKIFIPKGRLVMPQSICAGAHELFKDLKFSPAVQKKLSRFEEHLKELSQKVK